MTSNVEIYKNDLKRLISKGEVLLDAIQNECHPVEFEAVMNKAVKDEQELQKYIEKLPRFANRYQSWYSESLAIVKLLLPDRIDDFKKLYEKPKGRKEISYENYVVEDYLQGLSVTRGYYKEKVVGPDAAIPKFTQQLFILKSVEAKFESSLFDIKQLLQADLFDSELEAAKELNKKGFVRGAGAMAGVVLELHLNQVCNNHKIKFKKKNPTISEYNDQLKNNDIIEIPTWRFIQHLGDIRNKCDHKKKADPTREEIEELIEGVEKISKTVF